MITGPSSANRSTTSAFQKTRLLVLHCSASWWVPSNARAEFAVIYSCNSDYNTPISQSLAFGLFYCGCIPDLFASLQCPWTSFNYVDSKKPLKKEQVFIPKLWPGLKPLFITYCYSTFLSQRDRMVKKHPLLSDIQLWKCPNDIFAVGVLCNFLAVMLPLETEKVVLFPVFIWHQTAALFRLNISVW